MSTNCTRCFKEERTGPDLLCDGCREIERLTAALSAANERVKELEAIMRNCPDCHEALCNLKNAEDAAARAGKGVDDGSR